MPAKKVSSKCGLRRRIAKEVSSQKATDVVQSKGNGPEAQALTSNPPAKKPAEKPKPSKKK
jgi:hypothetical protein